MRPIAKYKEILKRKGFRYSFHEVWMRIQRFHFIMDNDILYEQWKYIVHKQLLKKYRNFNHTYTEDDAKNNPYPDKIWICWFQGEGNAPLIVKKCIASIRKNAGNKEVIILTDENIPKYIQFPDFILKKRAKGKIPRPQFSDLLRVSLLAKYGGIWIDATVLLTGPIPDYITEADLFCFKTAPLEGRIKMSSWFISAKANNEILVRTQQLVMQYWKNYNWLKHYFIFHLLFSIAIDSRETLRNQWKKIPYFNNSIPHTLLLELHDSYTPERWEQIKNLSPIHKLTYKFKPSDLERKDSFLNMIMNS